MIGVPHRRQAATIAVVWLVLAMLAGCAGSNRLGGGQPDQTAALPPSPPPAPPPSKPPPVDLAGRWKLSVAGGGACLVTLGATPGSTDGTVAPAGGCPGNYFTSRKWTFEHDRLIIRNHKSEVLVELSFADGRFEGQAANGGATTLARP